MAKSGTYRFCHTWARYNDAGTMVYETGRSPILGPKTVTGSISYSFTQPTDTQLNRARIYSTLNGGSVYYLEQVVTITPGGGIKWVHLDMADTTLDDQATAYFTNKGYETKRLSADGVLPPIRCVLEASGRLWGLGRMHRTGTSEHATLYWSELAPNWRDWPTVNANNKFADTLTGQYEENELVYVFTRSARWRVTPATYNAGMQFDKLEGGIGCMGHHTIIKIGSAVAWMAADGFYITAGDQQPQLISGEIEETFRGLRKDRALFAQGRHDRVHHELQWWVSDGTNRLNNLCLAYDYSDGLLQGRWYTLGGHGRSAMSLGEGLMPDGSRVYFIGDHLGQVWQEDIGRADGMGLGGTYQGTLGQGTTTTTSTTTTTTSTTTTV